jgi:hypothetical protein
MTHDGDLRMVYDQHGYTCGYVVECTCGFIGDLRERHGQALCELQDHLNAAGVRPRPKESTA